MIVPFIEKHLADIDKVIVDPEQQLPGLNRTEDPSVSPSYSYDGLPWEL